jgi:hypothetical protein
MKFIQYLQEEYITNVKGTWSKIYSGLSDVFSNPSVKELQDLDEELRFIINFETKKLYVWNWDITHTEMARHLYKMNLIPYDQIETVLFLKTCYAGIANKKSGTKLDYKRCSDCIHSGISGRMKWLNGTDDAWLKPWFDGSFINMVKKKFGIEIK